MNEPKLRFKADDGGKFPDWEEKKLGDITEKVVRKNEKSNADVRMISQGNGFILQSDKYSRENAGQSLKKYTLLKRSEFAYNHGASKVKPYGVCYRLCESDEARVPYVYHTFRLIEGDSDFWNYSLNTSYMDRQLKKMVSSGARMDGLLNISYDAYMSVNIHAPSLPEQQKIAEFLSTIDTVIEKQKETVFAWEERKKGMMQKLFSQKVRFKTDDGSEFSEWEKKPFGDVVSEFKVKTKVEDEDTLLSCAINGVFLNSELFDHQRGQSNIGYLKIKKGTLILSAQNLHLGNANVNLRFEHGIISPAYKTYDIVGCSAEYMSQWVKWDMTKQFFYNATTVGASECRRNVDWNMLYSQLLPIPCLAEQQKIADCLSALDEVIEKQKATLAAWKEMKKGLLQQMFV